MKVDPKAVRINGSDVSYLYVTYVSVRKNYFSQSSSNVTRINVVGVVAVYDDDEEEEDVVVAVFCNDVQEN